MFAYCGNNPISFSDPSGFARKHLPIYLDDGFEYITDQDDDPWGDMTLGSSTIGKMGCGLVAVYNAMISLDDPRLFSEIYEFFDYYPSGLTDHGKNGLSILDVVAYFAYEGYDVVVASSLNIDQFMLYSQSADACIMLYQYGSVFNPSGHYIEFSITPEGYVGRNTAEGNGIYAFTSPVEYGFKSNRFFFFGIFVFKPNQ